MSVLAIDIGSSRVKALLAGWDGRLVEVRQADTPRQTSEPGESAFPADVVWTTIESLITGLAQAHDDGIDTVVFSCLGTAMAPLDEGGRPLGPALAPADERPVRGPGLTELLDIDSDELRQRTGSDPAVASFLLHALWWQRERPETAGRLHRYRSLRGYAMQELCAVDVEDRSWASRTMLVDLETGDWSADILSAAGLSGSVLPSLETPTKAYAIRPEQVSRLGLAEGAVAVLGAMDNCCSLLGADGPWRSGLVNIVGTYEHMAGAGGLAQVREVAATVDTVIHAYLQPDQYITMTRVPMGGLLTCAMAGRAKDLDTVMRNVSPIPLGQGISLEEAAVQAAVDAGEPRAAIVQALVESGTAVLRRFADAWAGLGLADSPVVAVGGGARHTSVLELKANLLDRAIITLQSDQGAGLGALRLAAMARAGLSKDDACALFANPITRTIQPRSVAGVNYARG